jgi:hypothetical protein
MLNFQQKKPNKNQKFTLDRVQLELAKKGQPIDIKRYLHLLFLLGIAIVSGALLWSFVVKLKEDGGLPYAARLQDEVALVPMAKPSIATLAPLPNSAELAEQKELVEEQFSSGRIPLWVDQPDANTFAWIRKRLAQDISAPSIAQRVEARDLVLRHLKVGSTVIVTGLLEDSQPAPIDSETSGFQHLLLALPNEQYIQVLAPASAQELLMGEQVQVIGRFLGFSTLPPADVIHAPAISESNQIAPTNGTAQPETSSVNALSTNSTPATPSDAAPSMVPPPKPAPPKAVSLPYIAARVAAHPAKAVTVENPYAMSGNWRMPDDLYANIDDELLLIETRPYYYTLGQVLIDRTTPGVYDQVKSANEFGSQIHRAPAEYRGQQFKIHGKVFHAWEDEGVAYDKPFGIDRVVRVIMWSEDWGDWYEQEGDKVVTKRKLILRTFEAAMITHLPLPKANDAITMTGRFLRIRAMEVERDPVRDRAHGVRRHSDRSYTFLFVTGDYELVPPPPTYDFTPLIIIIGLIGFVLCAVVFYSVRKEGRRAENVQDSVRRLRETRQALLKQKVNTDKNQKATGPVPQAPPSPESDPPQAS